MKELRLLKALGQIDPKYVEEALQKPRRRWRRALAIAACLLLVVSVGGTVIDRLGLFRAGCSAWPGDFVDGRYYFNGGHGSLYCWNGETTEKVLGALQSDGWLVNEYGVYFERGRRLFVMPHATGKPQKLYTAPLFGCSHMGIGFYGEDLTMRLYDKKREWFRELLLDGATGQVLEEVQPLSDYDLLYDNLAWSDTHLIVGERQLALVPLEEEGRFDIVENGKSILPEGATVSSYYHTKYDQIWFDIRLKNGSNEEFAVLPDGDDRLITLNGAWQAAGDFAYCVKYDDRDAIWCMDTRSGESWQLHMDNERELYELATDGVHLVTCVPWDDYQALWKVEYDSAGQPAGLTLLDADIRK